MQTIVKTLIAVAGTVAMSLPVGSVAASFKAANPEIYAVNVAVNEQARTLDVEIELDPRRFSPGSDGEQIFIPMVISADSLNSMVLDTIRICGRNRWYQYVREGALDGVESPSVFRAGKSGKAVMKRTVELQSWMEHSTVELCRLTSTCCRPATPMPGTGRNGMTEIARISTRRPALIREFVFAPPVNDAPVEKNIEGRAFVLFVVNRTELKPDYMLNRSEIAKIINSIDYVRNDSDAIITGIHIKGFASPEGSYSNNVRLAMGRTVTLTDYVRNYSRKFFHLPDSIFSNSFEPEDWTGLRRYVADSLQYNIGHRPEILAIIDSPMDPDVKNDLIKRTYPRDYGVILSEIYPWLRHSDYTVSYRIKIYTDISDLRRLYDTDPTRLRPVDFYTLAGQYAEGSPGYNDVMLRACQVYPDDPMLNLNAASIALMTDNNEQARRHLALAPTSPEADFTRGVLAAREGDYDRAERLFERASKAGITKADDYLDNLGAIKNHISVSITAKTAANSEKKQ